MDSSMQNLLNGILSNPESMKQIMQLASSMGLINPQQAQSQPAPQAQPQQYIPQTQQPVYQPQQPQPQITLPPPVVPPNVYQQQAVPQQEQYMSSQPYAQPVYATADTQTRAPTPFDPIRPAVAPAPAPQASPAASANPLPAMSITPEKAMEVLQSLQSSTRPLVEDNHMALISALKPFMRPTRQSSLDGASKLLGAYRAFKGMGLKLF